MSADPRWRGRLSAGLPLLVAVVLGALAVAEGAWADAPSAQFRAYLRSQFGVVNPRYARCPTVQRFDGTALCEAQFRPRRTWRFVSVTLRDGQARFPFTRTWTRRWRTCSRRSRSVPGRLRSNMGYCDYLMAGDVQDSVRLRGRFPRRVVVHGTNTLGFEPRVVFRCTRRQRTARCTNSLGDSFRYTVPR
jgi:hypothetical protein